MLEDEFSLKRSWIGGGRISLSDFGVDSNPFSWKSCEGVLSTAATGKFVFGDTFSLTTGLRIDEVTGRISLRGISEHVVPSWYGVVEQSYGYLQDASLEVFERWQTFEDTRFVPITRFCSDAWVQNEPSLLIRGTLWSGGDVAKSFVSAEQQFVLFMRMMRLEESY